MSIHRTDCINIINLSDVERSRLITAEWEDNDLEEGGQYLAELKIFADDRRGLLLDVSKVFTEEKIDVKSMNTRTSKKGTATMLRNWVNRHYIEKIPPKGANADGADGKQGGKVFSIQLFSFKKLLFRSDELNRVIGKLRQIENVIDIERTTG